MKFQQFYSGSNGNLYIVTANNGKRLMIECGVSWQNIEKALSYNLDNIIGCLLSHEHKDHSFAIEKVIEAGINVYSGFDTLKALGLEGHRRGIRLMHEGLVVIDDCFGINPFNIEHDAVEPLGFIVYEFGTKEYMLFATDTSHIKYRFGVPFSIVALECSYEQERLKDRVAQGEIPEVVARRLLDSHMEKHATMSYIENRCDLSKCSEIHLLHLSGDNLVKERTRREFEQKFLVKVVTL